MKGKKFALVLTATCLLVGCSSCGVVKEKFEYELSKDGEYYSLVNCDSPLTAKEIVIPDSYKGLPVKRIGKSAFSWGENITSVVIPESVSAIEELAFAYCCDLKGITLGANIVEVGNSAFEGCVQLTSIAVAKGNAYYQSIDGNLYTKNGEVLVQYATGKSAAAFTIPDGVKEIGVTAFGWCENLKSVTIGEGVTTIGESAFYWCDGLVNVTLPDSVTEIGDYAFSWCEELTSVTLGRGVTKIGKEAFLNSENLEKILFTESTGWRCTAMQNYTNGQSMDVSNPTQNAKLFLGDSGKKYWYRVA